MVSSATGGDSTCGSAGEHLPVAVFDEWYEKTGVRILDSMGSTEMLHAFIAIPRGDIRPGATGAALPGYTVTVLDENMNPAPPNAVGRLAVKGPIGCRYLDDVERRFPAEHYILVDDKLRILDAVKKVWGQRVTTVLPLQGQYAHDAKVIGALPPADVTIERIGDLLDYDLARLRTAALHPAGR